MKKMILTMLLASAAGLAGQTIVTAQDQEVDADAYETQYIKNLDERVEVDEHGIHSVELDKDDTLEKLAEFFELDVERIEDLLSDPSLELEDSPFKEDAELVYITNDNVLDALLVKLIDQDDNQEDDQEKTYLYLDFEEDEGGDQALLIDDEAYEEILETWKGRFAIDRLESGEDVVDLTPYIPAKDFDANEPVENNQDLDDQDEDLNEDSENALSDDQEDEFSESTAEGTLIEPEFIKDAGQSNQDDDDQVADLNDFEIDEFVNEKDSIQANDLPSEPVDSEVEEVPSIDNELATETVAPETDVEPIAPAETEVEDVNEESVSEEDQVGASTEVSVDEPAIIEEDITAEEVIDNDQEVAVENGPDYNQIAQDNPENKGLQPHVARFKEEVAAKYGITSFSLYRPGDPQDHGKGLAVDFMVPVGSQQGDDIANYSIQQMESGAENISYVIWEQQIYGDWSHRWEPMEDRGSITANHYDHVHVSFH